MTHQRTLKAIKEAIDPIRNAIMDAYEYEYAPECDECGGKAQLDRSKVDLQCVLDMANCLVLDWSGDPEYDKYADLFK